MPILLSPPPNTKDKIVNDNNETSKTFALWLFNLYNILNTSGAPAPSIATYVVNTAQGLLANAQVLANLQTGFVTVNNGTGLLNSTGSLTLNYSSIQQESANTILGNPTGSSSSPTEISLDGSLVFSGTALTLPVVNTNVGTYGNKYNTVTLTTTGKGLITAVTINPVAAYTSDSLAYAYCGGF